ncbi:zinc protease [Adhaeribacter aerolatus]|uniref:Zinc protease n=1 Tax=Adhaeribacter aerolatus TaxID=670289 RepID=A0A512AVX9_9BACT|nr:pitrilysin family protein [Adhaeribacter aerolatus]GEO03830.1 zinc protease [Adhaeribacter aerolatus]
MLDRTIAPAIQKISSIQLPDAEITALPNGARLHCLYNFNQPVLKLEIVFKAGKWYEPAPGISYFTSKLLLEGTRNYSAKQIADMIAYYGASLECNQGFDRATLTLYCLAKHLVNLLPLLKEVITQPTFPENEFILLKKRTLQNIGIEKQKNTYLATKLLTESIFGGSHPYVAGLDEAVLENVSLTQVNDFFRINFSLSGTEIFFSGAIEPAVTEALVSLFNQIEVNHQALPVTSHSLRYQPLAHYIEREDQMQTTVRIGGIWPLMHDKDFSELLLLNKILGGYFGSRLMKNIREDKGFTYGIFSTVSAKEYATMFYIGTDVNYQNSGLTVAEIQKEIQILQNEPVPEDELDAVRNYTIGKFINDTNNIFDQVDKYKSLVLHNLPITHYSDYLQRISEVGAYRLTELAQQYLNMNDLTTVLVGKEVRA